MYILFLYLWSGVQNPKHPNSQDPEIAKSKIRSPTIKSPESCILVCMHMYMYACMYNHVKPDVTPTTLYTPRAHLSYS